MDERQQQEAEMAELAAQLNRYAFAYYTKDKPLVSDGEYDQLYQKLEEMEKNTGITLPQSPTQRVGDRLLPGFQKHKHRSPLWSLEKIKSTEEAKEWEGRIRKLSEESLGDIPYVVTMKFDGLTVNLTYKDGHLVNGATRGTGEIGEAILPQVLTIPGIPPEIDSLAVAEIRGEALMTREAFEAYNAEANVPLKNLRNGAAGALRNLDINETRRRRISVYFYEIGHWEGQGFTTYAEELAWLENQGFPMHSYHRLCRNLDEALEAVWEIEASRDQLNFDIDGAVIAINALPLREQLGYTAKFPRWAVAYKFEAVEATTQLLDVEWNVGRTGKVTPTAILEPVELGGVTISRATLNNIDDIRRKGIYLGAEVFIRRSNDVIPEILGVVGEEDAELAYDTIDAGGIMTPMHCPDCGSALVRDGVHYFCPNAIGCRPQMVKALAHFAGREGANIEGFSEKTADALFAALDLKRVDDLYHLTKAQLMSLDHFLDKRAENLLAAIEKSKKLSLDAFIYGLGIQRVGKQTARELARAFGQLDALMGASVEELVEIPDIGEITAEGIYRFFRDDTIQEVIHRLLEAGVCPENIVDALQEQDTDARPFVGKNIVATGTLQSFSRKEIEDVIRQAGALAQSSVTKVTDYVVAGENPGSKLEKARILQADSGKPEILSEEVFLQMLGRTRDDFSP